MTTKPRAYSYIRFSTPEQSRGDSHRRQLELSKKYALENNLELSEETFNDLGVSAYRGANADQGMLGVFLEAVDSGRIRKGSYLLVESLDRLSRSKIIIALNTLLAILERGITVVTLSDSQVYTNETINDFTQLLISLSVMARSHEESRIKSERVSAAWQSKRDAARDSKKPISSRCPQWIRLKGELGSDSAEYELIPERAVVVQEIFDLRLSGLGALKIAKMLNERGEPPFGRGKMWYESYVKKILNNHATYGQYQPSKVEIVDNKKKTINDGPSIDGYYPAAISKELFFNVKASRRNHKPLGRSGNGFTNLFKGLLVCGACGSPTHYMNKGKPPKGRSYIQCRASKMKAGCGAKPLRYEFIEDNLIALFSELDYRELVPDRSQNNHLILQKKLDSLTEELQSVTQQLAKLVQALAIDEDDQIEEIVNFAKEKRQRKTDLESQIETLKFEIQDSESLVDDAEESVATAKMIINSFYIKRTWDKEGHAIQREILNAFYRKYIKKIEVSYERLVIHYNNNPNTDEVRLEHYKRKDNSAHVKAECRGKFLNDKIISIKFQVLLEKIKVRAQKSLELTSDPEEARRIIENAAESLAYVGIHVLDSDTLRKFQKMTLDEFKQYHSK